MKRLVAAFAAAACSVAFAGPVRLVQDTNHGVSLPVNAPGAPVAFGSGWLTTLCWTVPQVNISLKPVPPAACNPFITDGTADGTHALQRLDVLSYTSAGIGGYTVVGSDAYFLVARTPGQLSLWKTDGTAAGTTSLATLTSSSTFPSPVLRMASVNSLVFFVDLDGGLWRSDGTASGTFRLVDGGVGEFVAGSDRVYFTGFNASVGLELFSTDGTLAGTSMVKDINPGTSGSGAANLAFVNGKLMFWAHDNDFSPNSPWSSDGTAAGTQKVSDIAPSSASPYFAIGSSTYFLAGNISTSSVGLWRTDGTAAGTSAVGQWSGALQSGFGQVGGFAFFVIDGGLWRTDGTAAGTAYTAINSVYAPFVSNGSDLAISSGYGVWRAKGSDGSTSRITTQSLNAWGLLGDRLVANDTFGNVWQFDASGNMSPLQVASGEPSNGSSCTSSDVAPLSIGSKVVFAADDGVHGCELWSSDGTDAGTSMLADITPGADGSSVLRFTACGNDACAAIGMQDGHSEIWRTDGTAAGTQRAATLGIGYVDSLVAIGSTLFFNQGSGLYRLDAGSSTPATLYGPGSRGLQVVSDGLFFTSGGSLFKTDGVHPPVMVAPLGYVYESDALGNVGIFISDSGVFRSDGTSAGTYRIAPFTNATMHILGVSNARLFFVTGDTPTLYQTDGTLAGTTTMGGFGPFDLDQPMPSASNGSDLWIGGRTSAGPGLYRVHGGESAVTRFFAGTVYQVAATAGAVYFAANDSVHGTELWMQPASTWWPVLLDDSTPGAASTVYLTGRFRPAVLASGVFFFSTANGAGLEPTFLDFDSTPDALSIPSLTGVPLDSTVVSSPVQVLGITTATPITATGGEFCVSSGDNCQCNMQPYSTSGSAVLGEYICVRHQSAFTPGTLVVTQLTLGSSTASFSSTTLHAYAVSVALAGAGSGSVVSLPDGIACGTTCAKTYFEGTHVHLVAVRAPGSIFTGWSGACSGAGDCDVTLGSDVAVTATFAASTVARLAGDFDGDGRTDLAWRNSTTGAQGAWIMDGTTPTSYAGLSGGSGYTIKLTGDFDGDGRTDVLYRGADGSYKIQLLNGTSVVAENVILNGGTGWEVVGKGDFDGDGKTDLLWKASNGTYGLWLMNGTTFSSAGLFQAPGPGWDSAVVADFDGDGKSDILWQQTDGRVQMWLMNGFLSTAQADMVTTPNGWTPVLAADLDGNGKADLVWKHTNGSIGIWMVDGTTITSYSVVLGGGTGWSVKFSGDLDGDGKADLVLTHTAGSVGAWLMNGASIASYGTLINAGSGWGVVGTGDFNGDGRTDLVWRATDGSYGIWLMDGLVPFAYAAILGGGTGWSTVP